MAGSRIVARVDEMSNDSAPYEKAIEETAKATGKALDVVQSMSPAIASAYGLLIGDRIAASRERNLDAITRKTRKILEDRKIKDSKPIPEQIGVRLLEEAKGETRESIQDLYATLLANAMDERFSEDVRPEFILTIKQLQPSDMMVLKFALELYQGPSKIFGSNHVAERLTMVRPTAIELSLEHLTKIGCLREHPQGLMLSNFGAEFMAACDPHANVVSE